jgi:hypothetical protein
MFEQIVKHASTNTEKLPIAFPSIICGIILSQKPGILSTSDIPSRRKPPLSIHYKLFEGSHVNDIVMTSAMKKPASQGGLIAQLKETCKELETGIRVAKARKEALEVLISSLEQGEMDNVGEAKETDAHTSSERSESQDQSSDSSGSEGDEDATSSH